jgi:formimidoylglutamate deiminase
MCRQYYLEAALLPQGWVRGALVTVAADGFISAIDSTTGPGTAQPVAPRESGAAPAAAVSTPMGQAAAAGGEWPRESVAGIVVPGMSNAHSHAFQRAMAGNAEYRLSAHDSFWTWRQAMYALANRIEPPDLRTLATQLYIEMLKSGYTAVAEFHYLHRTVDGENYTGRNALWDAIAEAATLTGIALTLLPTLYQTSDFGAQPLRRDQARFALDTDHFLRAVEERIADERHTPRADRRTGAAFHSLRAVPLETLQEVAHALRRMDATLPLHIHVAEQKKEVEACELHTARRPIDLLLQTGLLDRHWCLVHATHATAAELRGIAASQAAVCVSISTEANLGDGVFDAAGFLRAGGRVCIGSDSQATVCPAEELRWMEYQQRLRKRRRGVLADAAEAHVGTRLWSHAARCGAQAIGQPAGGIAVGERADWLVLDPGHATMAGAPLENALDHLLFAGGGAAIRDVMVAGRWVIRERHHALEQPLRGQFAELMGRLAAPGGSGQEAPAPLNRRSDTRRR